MSSRAKLSAINSIEFGDQQPDYYFANLQGNYDTDYGSMPAPAVLNVLRNQPIVTDMSAYVVSICRMSFPALGLPLWCPPLLVNTDYSENATIFSFTLKWTATGTGAGQYTSQQQYVVFVPQNTWAKPGTGLVYTSLQTSNPYYYIYNYTAIFQMLSNCLKSAFDNLKTAVGAGGATFPAGAVAPVMYFDRTVGRPVLKCQIDYYDPAVAAGGNAIEIYFNNDMAPILNGMYFNRVANNSSDGADNLFVISNEVNNIDPADMTMYLFEPPCWTANYLNPINTLQLTTSIPTVYELVQAPNYSYAASPIIPPGGAPTNSVNPSAPILSDLQINLGDIQNTNDIFQYDKQDTWRFSTISATGPLQNFTVKLYWTDFAGNQMSVNLYPGTNFTLKLGFFKRDLFKSNGFKIADYLHLEAQ
jgi:hypothetical protein